MEMASVRRPLDRFMAGGGEASSSPASPRLATLSAESAAARRRSLQYARKIVIKVGTPVVTHGDGNIALGRIGSLVEQIAVLRQDGCSVVIVTSGAISTGSVRTRRNMTLASTLRDSVTEGMKPTNALNQNVSAALGQSMLMNMYEGLFSKYDLSCGQVLITSSDVEDAETLCQFRDTLAELLQLGTVPIVNENDAVTDRTVPVLDEKTSEVIWDNDELACRVAVELRADLLILLTDIDGLYAQVDDATPPKRLPVYLPGAKLVRDGINLDTLGAASLMRGAFATRTRIGADGLDNVVRAARGAVLGGVPAAVVTSGHHPQALLRVVRGEDTGTLFSADGVRSKL